MLTINLLLTLTVKPLVLIALAWQLIRQEGNRSASHQHLLTTALLWGLPLLLLLSCTLPAIAFNSHWLSQASDMWRLPSGQWLPTAGATALLGLYLFGLLFLLFYQALGLGLLAQVSQESLAATPIVLPKLTHLTRLRSRPQVVISPAIRCPQTWGWRRPVILLPVDFFTHPDSAQTLALLHELGHIQRGDWLVSQLTRLVCALFWFLPPVWWLARQQAEQAERATDDWVLAHQGRTADYADLLLQSAKALRRQALPTQALNGSPLFQRVNLLLDGSLDRQPREPQSLLQGLLVVGISALLLGAAQLQPAQSAAPQRPALLVTLLPKEVPAQSAETPSTKTHATAAQAMSAQRAAFTQVARQPQAIAPMETVRVVASSSDSLTRPAPATEVQVGRPQLPNVLPLELVTPSYPKRALARGIEGTVTLAFAINPEGRAQDIQVLGQANSLLAQAAADALSQSRFARPTLHQQPFTLTGLTEEYRFRILTEPPDT